MKTPIPPYIMNDIRDKIACGNYAPINTEVLSRSNFTGRADSRILREAY